MSLPEGVALLAAVEGGRAANDAGPPLEHLVLRLTIDALREVPKRREYQLHDARTGKGVLARGKVALLAAKGGAGKTMALLQLAASIATARPWFGEQGWETREPGRVLLALGEEDPEEVLRRLHVVCRSLGLSVAEFERVALNVVVLPLAGHGAALTYEADSAAGGLPETPRAEALRGILRDAKEKGQPFTLIGIDPLSRFAGADVEKDNAAATRFIQVCESFASAECGGPSVLVVHHLRKAGKDEDGEASELIRGAVGLVDGVRWAAVLAQQKPAEGAPDILRLRVVKTNYAACPEPLMLCRPADGEGTLRTATPNELLAYQETARSRNGPRRSAESPEDIGPLVLAQLKKGPASGSELTRRLKRRKAEVLQALTDLQENGRIQNVRRQWSLLVPEFPSSGEPSGTDGCDRFPSSRPPFRGRNPEPEPITGDDHEDR